VELSDPAPGAAAPDRPLRRELVTEMLSAAGCIAAPEEADELIRAAGGDRDVLDDLVSRRTNGEPIAWLTGSVSFCDVEGGVAVDLCTGAGAIAAVLGAAVPTARVLATDIDPDAVRCARRNGVEVFEGFLDDPLPPEFERRVDVMTAVVPYVPTGSLRLLPRDVQAFEPRLALDGGPEGTDMLEEVVRRSPRWLAPGGSILLELGGDQAEPLRRLLRQCGFGDVDVMVDEEGDRRAIGARLG
jgi:release factor glutamine methyltransferase